MSGKFNEKFWRNQETLRHVEARLLNPKISEGHRAKLAYERRRLMKLVLRNVDGFDGRNVLAA